MSNQGIGTATGKIILMGEHAVVYGEPAIAFPFGGTQVTATVTLSKENNLTSIYHVGLLDEAPESLLNIQQLTNKLQEILHAPNFHLTIESTIPSERGMGSSAAVAVAITRAFFDWQDQELTQADLLKWVDFSEAIAHGNPSGIDAAATSGEAPIYFKRDFPFESFPLNIDAYLLVADTGIKGQTRSAVRSVAALMEQQPEEISGIIHQLGQLTQQARTAIIENQATLLGQLMTQAQAQLKQLTVSNEMLDDLVTIALNHGALGAKLTGGGRGGCLLVLIETKAQVQQITEAFQAYGVNEVWLQGLGVYQHV